MRQCPICNNNISIWNVWTAVFGSKAVTCSNCNSDISESMAKYKPVAAIFLILGAVLVLFGTNNIAFVKFGLGTIFLFFLYMASLYSLIPFSAPSLKEPSNNKQKSIIRSCPVCSEKVSIWPVVKAALNDDQINCPKCHSNISESSRRYTPLGVFLGAAIGFSASQLTDSAVVSTVIIIASLSTLIMLYYWFVPLSEQTKSKKETDEEKS